MKDNKKTNCRRSRDIVGRGSIKKLYILLLLLMVISWYGCSKSGVKTADPLAANKLFFKALTVNTGKTSSLSVSRNTMPGYYIVQLRVPITSSIKQSIMQTGVGILDYIPENAFIIKVTDMSALTRLNSMSAVKWIGLYKPQYKISSALNSPFPPNLDTSPSLKDKAGWIGLHKSNNKIYSTLNATVFTYKLNKLNSITSTTITVTIQMFQGGDFQTVLNDINAAAGNIITMSVSSTGSFIRAQIPSNQINTIANIPDVEWIEPYIPPRFMNDIATDIIRASTNNTSLSPTGVWSSGFTGAGQAVAIADTGLDIGNSGSGSGFVYNSAIGDYEANSVISPFHPAFIGKTVHAYALGRPGDFSDPNTHGTHVAGSVLGHDTQTLYSSFPYWGSAYGVNDLVFMSILDSNGGLGGLPLDLNTLFDQEYTDTLSPRIASNSWGAQNFTYDVSAEQVDNFIWNHPDMTILFAAGNAGVDANNDGVVDLGSLGTPATAKDVITVGASENLRPSISLTWGDLGFTSTPLSSDLIADNISGMAAFSSRGPAPDGRIKPDIVAPGTMIISVRSQDSIAFADNFENGAGKWAATVVTPGTGNTWSLMTDAAANSYEKINSSGNNLIGNLSPISAINLSTSAVYSATLNFYVNVNLTAQDQFNVYYYDADHGIYFQPGYMLQGPVTEYGNVGTSPIGYDYQYYNYLNGYNVANNYAMTPTQAQGFNFLLQFSSASTPINTAYMEVDNVSVCPTGWGLLGNTSGLSITYDSQENQNYLLDMGTSMATPLAAGAAADVRGAMVGAGITDPSAALVKAALINGAVDMYPGQYGTGQYLEMPQEPNDVEGFGRVNLINSLKSSTTKKIYMLDYTAGNGLVTGGMKISYMTVDNNTDPLKMTLVWTDYPSTPSASVNIVNVLHFSLTTTNKTIIYPNGLSNYDDINNVQQITVPSPQTGVYTVYVAGYSVPMGTSAANDQPYALVMSGDIQGLSSLPPPPAPTGLTATAGNGQVILSWNVSTGVTSYNVYQSTISGGPYTKVGSSTSTGYTATGLTNGTAYYFVVTAVNGNGESGYSNQATATPSSTGSTGSRSSGCMCELSHGSSNTWDLLPAIILLIGWLGMVRWIRWEN